MRIASEKEAPPGSLDRGRVGHKRAQNMVDDIMHKAAVRKYACLLLPSPIQLPLFAPELPLVVGRRIYDPSLKIKASLFSLSA